MFETTGSGESLQFTEDLTPLKFVRRKPQIVNDILMDEQADTFTFREDAEAITPQHVEYYWDCRLDKEIPLDDLCKGQAQLKAAGISDDLLDIECPDDIGQASIYGSQVTSIEDCN